MEEIYNNIYLGDEYPYLRPYLCNGNPYEAKICFIGTNPATPIYPFQAKLSEYTELFRNYEAFMDFYKQSRKSEGKTEISRTRMGITAFSEWLNKEFGTNMIETDIFTYPTKSIRELKNVDKEILLKSIRLFENVLKEFNPPILILHGSLTVNTFRKLMENKDIKYNCDENKIEKMEQANPFAEFELNGRKIKVLVSKHFMYYGRTGNSFKSLKHNLSEMLSKEDKNLEI